MTRSTATHHAHAAADADPHAEGEAIERQALHSLHAVATPEIRKALGLAWTETTGATASIAAALPASAIVVNRAFLTDRQAVADTAEVYRAAGVGRYFLHLPPDVPPRRGTIAPPGYREARSWQKFVRRRGAPIPDAPAFAIERITPGPAAAAVARIVCAAFDLGERAEVWLARLCRDPRWQVFLARVDGRPAGTGALFVSDRIGWSDWGATAPDFRGRGVQRALLRHRLVTAEALGLDRVHTCTGAPAPGDPQHSYRNILRCGFGETVVRRNLTLADMP